MVCHKVWLLHLTIILVQWHQFSMDLTHMRWIRARCIWQTILPFYTQLLMTLIKLNLNTIEIQTHFLLQMILDINFSLQWILQQVLPVTIQWWFLRCNTDNSKCLKWLIYHNKWFLNKLYTKTSRSIQKIRLKIPQLLLKVKFLFNRLKLKFNLPKYRTQLKLKMTYKLLRQKPKLALYSNLIIKRTLASNRMPK